MTISFLTAVTPLVFLAIFTAWSASACDSAVPDNWIKPLLSVSTLMSVALTPLSLANPAFTLAVITASLNLVDTVSHQLQTQP